MFKRSGPRAGFCAGLGQRHCRRYTLHDTQYDDVPHVHNSLVVSEASTSTPVNMCLMCPKPQRRPQQNRVLLASGMRGCHTKEQARSFAGASFQVQCP